jgi:rhamnosyltransferase
MKNIAIIGARGVGNYGGFETYVRDILPYLSKGFDEVYVSTELNETKVPGLPSNVTLIPFPLKMPTNVPLRHLVEFFTDIYFGIYFIAKKKVQVCYYLGPSIGLFSAINRSSGQKVAINMAGLEWKRSKFSAIEKSLLYLQFWTSQLGSDHFIVDNEGLIEYVDPRNRWKTHFHPYGVHEPLIKDEDMVLGRYDLKANDYLLSIVRLQPDNNIIQMIEMYGRSSTTKPFFIVGGLSSKNEFMDEIKRAISLLPPEKKVIMPGGIYDQNALNVLRKNSFLYIHPHSIGGTNPSLLEAMVCRCAIMANDTTFNRNVGADAFLYYSGTEEGAERIDLAISDPVILSKLREMAYAKVKKEFNYDKIGNDIVNLLKSS